MLADYFKGGVDQKKRIEAYCRISTEFEEQHKSLEAQMNYYESLILNNPDWEFAGSSCGKRNIWAVSGWQNRSTNQNRLEGEKGAVTQ